VRVLVVDNYDSFTFNLVDLIERLGARCEVVANDEETAEQLLDRQTEAYLVSAGPCTPAESGSSLPLLSLAIARREQRPIFGVCLGLQALAVACGGRVARARLPMHGKLSRILHDGRTVYAGTPQGFEATRYNSLVVDPTTLSDELEVTAWTEEGEVMGLRHRALPIEAVQFHPESILSAEHGPGLVRRWLALCAGDLAHGRGSSATS
jgi:anthranilate synthase/aminodeoxychorismate synthase-like glutamine amidotransferase